MQIRTVSSKRCAPATEAQRTEVQERIKKMRKEGDKLVKGMFEFIDAQGGWFDFSYRFFPGDPVSTVRINHCEIVELPMILVKHLNNIYRKVRVPPENYDQGKSTITRYSRTRFTPADMLGSDVIGTSAA